MHAHEVGRARERRGAILLLVLSMLTLFLMMGALAILTATRARETSAGFAAATAGVQTRAILAKSLVNEALMVLIRGSDDSAWNELLCHDSLLEDMYGTNSAGAFWEEPYDAYDDNNPFLTHMALDADGRAVAAIRPAFAVGANAIQPTVVDNDGDGVPDGIWLPPSAEDGVSFLSPIQSNGRAYQFRISYLVLDLDGRINVNTHGRPPGDTKSSQVAAGPADLDGRPLLGTNAWSLFLAKTNAGPLPNYANGDVSPNQQWRQPLNLSNQRADGRFGGSGINTTYALRLDLEAPRSALIAGSTVQNPFTLGELERVLRQHDPDAYTLPARLEGMLGDRSERSRMRVTTDSWEYVGNRLDFDGWKAPNSGRPYENEFHGMLFDAAVTYVPAAVHSRLSQWLANVVDFRDKDNANTRFTGNLRGAEPKKDGNNKIPGPWNDGNFLSYAALVGVPQGTPAQVSAAVSAPPNQPVPLVSLVLEYPKMIEAFMTRSPFHATIAADPRREPGRVNVNTCDDEVWKIMIGEDTPNPFGYPNPPAHNRGEMLLDVDLVFNGDHTFDVRSVNHDVANRLANVAAVRSHVFAVWITLEISDTAPFADPPSYHRLFAIVDRSIPVTFERGRNTDARNTIRLVRFLN